MKANGTSWGKPIGCSVPASSRGLRQCSRPARYLYMADGTVDVSRHTPRQVVDGLEGTCVWAECAQHRRAGRGSFATIIRPRPWEFTYLYDAAARGTVVVRCRHCGLRFDMLELAREHEATCAQIRSARGTVAT